VRFFVRRSTTTSVGDDHTAVGELDREARAARRKERGSLEQSLKADDNGIAY
jgi:hypothetical protein